MKTFSIPPSPLVGQVLNYLLELVLDDPEVNEKERLMKEAEFFLKNVSTNSADKK
jgi:poly(A) polymerase/tRNA nucleotidyltransferase (CCA-adding enzyme)